MNGAEYRFPWSATAICPRGQPTLNDRLPPRFSMPPALVLFDIDGTLVRRAGPHHRQALVDAVRDIAGLETTTEGIPVQGMLDPDILTTMMLNAGVEQRL